MTSDTSDIDRLISSFIPHKSEQDGLLSTASVGIIIGCIVLIGIAPSLSLPVRISLCVSIGSLTIGLFLLLWFNPRLGKRNEKMKIFLGRRLEKTKEDIGNFVNTYEAPLIKQALIANIQKLTRKSKIRNEDDYQKIIDMSIEKTRAVPLPTSKDNNLVLKLLYKDLVTDLCYLDEKIYHKPMEESYGKLKCYLDIFSFKFRYHFFVVGVVSLAFAIITHLLLK